jgi:glutathione S-transferase
VEFPALADHLLLSSPPSPFGRKVKIAAAVLGLGDRIAVEHGDTTDPGSRVRRDNPLGKIPILILPDSTQVYDSRVIVEYLDLIAGGGILIPSQMPERLRVLRLQALADGIMDAALLRRYEQIRQPGERSASWDDNQAGKVERGLAALEDAPPGGDIDAGTIAVACALGYLDLRFEGAWRGSHPRLVAWLDRFAAAVPAFDATKMAV